MDKYYRGGIYLPTPQQQFERARQALACENGLHDFGDRSIYNSYGDAFPPTCRFCGFTPRIVERDNENLD